MSDLVKELRKGIKTNTSLSGVTQTMRQAADEIERLRGELAVAKTETSFEHRVKEARCPHCDGPIKYRENRAAVEAETTLAAVMKLNRYSAQGVKDDVHLKRSRMDDCIWIRVDELEECIKRHSEHRCSKEPSHS
jgi:hypothetical protein